MKINFWFFYFLLLPFLIFSQKSFNYTGFIVLDSSGSVYPFELNFVENDYVIDGVSITNAGFPDETKNKINGFYNKKDKKIKIQELSIIDTKSKDDKSEFCYLNMTLLKKKKELSGRFIGFFNDSTICEEGEVLLVEKKIISRQVEKVQKKIKNKTVDNSSYNDTGVEIKLIDDVLEKKSLVHQDIYSVSIDSSFSLSVWDDEKEDGDSIRILINDELFLDDFLITNKKRIISFEASTNQRIIKVIAVNVGEVLPNSVTLELVKTNHNQRINARLNTSEFIVLEIN